MKTMVIAAALLATALSSQAMAEGCMHSMDAQSAQMSKPEVVAQAPQKSTPADAAKPAATVATSTAPAPTTDARPIETASAPSAAPAVKPN